MRKQDRSTKLWVPTPVYAHSLLSTVLKLMMTLQTSSVYILLQTAACRRAIGDHQEAAEVYEHGIAAHEVDVFYANGIGYSHRRRPFEHGREDEASGTL
jgi:hypothetical protein